MGELKIGSRVRTPRGMQKVVSFDSETTCCVDGNGDPFWWDTSQIMFALGIPPLHAAVESRLRVLESEFRDERGIEDVARFAHRDLSEFSEALRKLLGESHE